MAEGLMEPSPPSSVPNGPADVKSEMAAAVASSDSLFSRRIEFHLERKPYSPISTASSQNFYLETLNPSSTTPQRPTAMAAARSAPSSGQSVKVSDCGLDPELSFRITFRRIGAGLQNLGNTCFLNSVLQCLTYTEPFAAYLQSGKHKSSCRTAGFCAMCALQNHVMNALQSSGKILSPLHLVKNLRCISRNFRISRQEDAHEYMVNLLESMHKCCLPSGVPTESPSAYEKSLVHKIFGGRLRSQVKCTQCQYCSNKFEPFLDLSLEIMKADSLRKALLHFTDIEQLDGGEKQYQCQRCKEKVRAYKQLTVHKAPHVLTIHLKRFGPHTGEKIDKRVEFQPTLDLKPFVSDPHEADLTYTLYGVLVHAGWSTRSGHYYCFVRTSSGMWHSLDDNQVLQVSEKTVLAQKAYMLFYVRDRSSTIKRAADVAQNFCAAASGNKIRTSSVLNGTIQNIERKSTFLGCSLAKTKADNPSYGHHVTVVDKSSGVALSNGGVSLQKNINIIPKESQLQSNGHPISNIASCLQRNGEAPSNGVQQTALLNVSKKVGDSSIKMPLASSSSYNQKLTETLDQLSHLKGGIIVPTSHVNSTFFTQKSGQKFEEKSRPYSSCNGKVNTIVLARQNPDNSDSLKPSIEKCSKSLLKERSIHENGSAASKVNDIPSTNGGSSSVNKELITNSSQLNHINGSVAEQQFNPDLAEHQNTGSEKNKHSSGLQYQKGRESHTNLDEFGLDTLVNVPSAEQGAVAVKETYNSVGKCSRSELKKEKHPRSLPKGHYFGRNQLFLKSLHLRKKKKHKRSKKRRLDHKKIMKDKIQEDINSDDQGASTSTSGRSDVAFMSSSKKRSRSSSEKENKMKNDVKHSNGDFEHSQILSRDSKNDVVVDILEQPRMPINSTGNPCNGKEADASSKTPSQNGVMSLLMGLKKTTVPRWDDVETPSSQSHDLVKVHDSSSIGYVLDEWDEEYDRGKRKKVKKGARIFGGPNPFQETANLKIQQKMKMKVDHVGSGNQPFRI